MYIYIDIYIYIYTANTHSAGAMHEGFAFFCFDLNHYSKDDTAIATLIFFPSLLKRGHFLPIGQKILFIPGCVQGSII